jgi:DNA polymerase-3 subunit beta
MGPRVRAFVQRGSLLAMAEKAARVSTRDTTNPAFAAALIEARDGTLSVTAADDRRMVTCRSQATVEEQGVAAVPCHRLLTFAKAASDGVVEMESDGSSATLRCGGAKAILHVMGDGCIGGFRARPVEGGVTADASELLAIAKPCSRQVAKETTRPELMGVHVVAGGGSLRMEACDTIRAVSCSVAADGSMDAIVPPYALTDALAQGDGEVELGLGDGVLTVSTGNCEYVTRTLSGTYPNISALFSGQPCATAVADSADLAAALDALATVDSPSVTFAVTEDGLLLSAATRRDGSADALVPADSRGDGSVALNPKYVRDSLVMGGEVRVELFGTMRPAFVKSDRYGWTCMLMPMRGDFV